MSIGPIHLRRAVNLTNLIGNGVATVVAAKWENELDEEQLYAALYPKAIKNVD